MTKLRFLLCGLLTVFIFSITGSVQAQSSSLEETIKQIQTLMAQVELLQKQLSTLRGEARDILRQNLAEGMSGEDIKKIQEILATDPSLYPEGRITGYYGPLTREALRRLQVRHQLNPTGQVDEETRLLLEGYLKERFGEEIPSGLLRAPGIAKKVEDRLVSDCTKSGRGLGPLCQRIKASKPDDNQKPESGLSAYDVKVEVTAGTTTVSLRYTGSRYKVETATTTEAVVLAAVADRLGMASSSLNVNLVSEIKVKLAKAIADWNKEEAKKAED
jgi:peptidoglycan hydrolase-like protein with peptidoglycan-binding domain